MQTDKSARMLSLKKVSTVSIEAASSTRYLILAVTILMLLFGSADVILFNMTVICMTKTVFINMNNETTPMIEKEEIEIFSTQEKGFLYSIVAIGCLISSLTVMKVISLKDGRFTFTLYTAIGGIATLLLPLCAKVGFLPVLIARGFQGIGVGMAFAFIGYMSAAWSPIKSNGIFLCALTSYNQLAPLITMPLAGFSCSSIFGWQGIYYLFGFLTLIVCAIFYYIYTDTPRKHKYVSPRELYKIESCKSIVEDRMKPKIPYYRMITDISVIGTLVVAIGDFVCFNIFMLFAPVYLNKVLGLDVKQTGISSAIPYIGSLVVKVFIGPLSDKLTTISMLNNVRIFMCISQLSMTICLIFLALIPTDWIFTAQLIYLIAIIGSAFNSVGYYKAASLSYGYFSSTVMSWFAIIYAIVILLLPLGKTYIAGEDSPEQWRLFFYIGAAIALATLIFWFFTADVELRSWAIIQKKPSIVSVITFDTKDGGLFNLKRG